MADLSGVLKVAATQPIPGTDVVVFRGCANDRHVEVMLHEPDDLVLYVRPINTGTSLGVELVDAVGAVYARDYTWTPPPLPPAPEPEVPAPQFWPALIQFIDARTLDREHEVDAGLCLGPDRARAEVAARRRMLTELRKIVIDGDYIDDGEVPLAEWMLLALASTDYPHPDYPAKEPA